MCEVIIRNVIIYTSLCALCGVLCANGTRNHETTRILVLQSIPFLPTTLGNEVDLGTHSVSAKMLLV